MRQPSCTCVFRNNISSLIGFPVNKKNIFTPDTDYSHTRELGKRQEKEVGRSRASELRQSCLIQIFVM
jgi:hypothetical protein